ncbi:alpha/beta fold hydrolase [Candidatus Daviesbacteria bacterium]|nr:alpha/beta fold hydrolase [Candidatus Daviesbacteria bacterium]
MNTNNPFKKKAAEIRKTLTDEFDYNLEFGGEALQEAPHPLSIEAMRQGQYPGSDLRIEQTLDPGSNYERYIVSYKSEGAKIYGLLTVPNGVNPPAGGWPVIIFNHGYIPPKEYRTLERYVAYVDGFAASGYIVLKPDYRGHGDSEGNASGGYGSNAYTVDILNAVSSIKKFKDADPEKIGMWGHSMGGFITLRNMVVSKDIKAGVIWAGVVASYPDLLNNWRRGSFTPPPGVSTGARRWRMELTEKYGTPEKNPQFWNSISANSFLADISGPLQLHHGTSDESVPVKFSQKLNDQMKAAKEQVELFTYPGDDHNLSANFSTAMQRSIEFFDKYLK